VGAGVEVGSGELDFFAISGLFACVLADFILEFVVVATGVVWGVETGVLTGAFALDEEFAVLDSPAQPAASAAPQISKINLIFFISGNLPILFFGNDCRAASDFNRL